MQTISAYHHEWITTDYFFKTWWNMAKRKISPFRKWENPKERDGYIRLAYGLIDSEAFLGLSGNAVKLYIYMREWAYKKEHSDGNALTYTLGLAKERLRISEPTANKALLELEKKGFIKRKNNSRATREPTQWEFSDKWYKEV